MRVTVCIPCYQQADTLKRTLDSVYAQTWAPIEIVIVDDGSPEPIKIEESHDYPHIHLSVIRVTNRGLPAARNVAIMHANGEAFLPIDADDWIEPTYIEKTLPLLEAGADVVLTGLQEHGTRGGLYNPGFDRPYSDVDEQVLWQYNRFFYCSLFRTKLLRQVGGYNPRMVGWPNFIHGGYEDWDLWIDLVRRGVKFAAVNEPLFNYTTKHDSMLAKAEMNRHVLVAEMRRHHQV